MSTLERNQAAAQRCVDLFNQKQIKEWVEACYAPDVEWIELPRPLSPNGQQGDRERIRLSAERVLALTPNRQMKVLNIIAQDDQVVLEIDWRGTTAAALGNLPAGSEVRYRVATFLTFSDGMIVKQVDYCIPIQGEVARQ
jgi:ketosteroid isomerase-like protein